MLESCASRVIIPDACPRVNTPWPLTVQDVKYKYDKRKPDARYLKRMRVGSAKTSLMNFVQIDASPDETAKEAAMKRRNEYVESVDFCELCNCAVIFDPKHASCSCPKCGDCKGYNVTDSSYRDGASIHVPYLCKSFALDKCENHLKDHVLRVQGKESTEIAPETIELIKSELLKRGDDLSAFSPNDIRQILKGLGLSKLYNHCYRIWQLTTGNTPPQMTSQQEQELFHIFKMVQEAWAKVKPAGRSNMLSYSFLLNKTCLLLGYTELASHFKLLKSRDKILQQDVYWQKICKELDFEFCRSVF